MTAVETRPQIGTSFEGSLAQCISMWESKIGRRPEILRVFSPGFVRDPTPILKPILDAGITPWWSTKWSPYPATDYPILAGHLHKLGKPVIVSAQHEPENDGGSMTPERFTFRSGEFFDAIRRASNAVIGEILMRESFHNGAAARWLVNNGKRHFIGVDGYNPRGPAGMTYEQLAAPVLAWAKRNGDVPIFWGEISTQGTDKEREAWMCLAHAHDQSPDYSQVRVFCHYHSAGGERAGDAPSWHLDQSRAGKGLDVAGSWHLESKPSDPGGPRVFAVGALTEDKLTPAVYADAMRRVKPRPLTGPLV